MSIDDVVQSCEGILEFGVDHPVLEVVPTVLRVSLLTDVVPEVLTFDDGGPALTTCYQIETT